VMCKTSYRRPGRGSFAKMRYDYDFCGVCRPKMYQSFADGRRQCRA